MLFAFAPRSFDDQRSQELSYLFLPVDPPEDIIISAPGKFEEAKVEAWYDSKDSEDIMANINIFTTSFVIALLLGWMYMFHKNARNFAQRIAVPLQKIGADMSKVRSGTASLLVTYYVNFSL